MKPEDLINNIQQATNLVAPFRKQIKLLAEENNALKSKLAKAREALERIAGTQGWNPPKKRMENIAREALNEISPVRDE